jgi:hypothetical protein
MTLPTKYRFKAAIVFGVLVCQHLAQSGAHPTLSTCKGTTDAQAQIVVVFPVDADADCSYQLTPHLVDKAGNAIALMAVEGRRHRLSKAGSNTCGPIALDALDAIRLTSNEAVDIVNAYASVGGARLAGLDINVAYKTKEGESRALHQRNVICSIR